MCIKLKKYSRNIYIATTNMSHIRKNIQQAKHYEEEALFEYEYEKQDYIVKERVRQAFIRSKVMEL